MTTALDDFIQQMNDAGAGTQPCGCDPCCPEDNGSAEGPWMVAVIYHQDGNAILRSTRENIGYRETDPGYNGVAVLTPGTELAVLEANEESTWYRVRMAGGQEGWIFATRTRYSSGLCLGHPFVDRYNGRDGSPLNALSFARSIMAQPLHGTDYANHCLGFVNDSYNITMVPTRCPLMYNPGRCRQPPSAIGAYRALSTCGKIISVTGAARTFPPGAIVFWDVSTRNGNFGHVAMVTEDGVQVISSGFIRDEDTPNEVPTPVTVMADVATVATWTDAATLGYTTAEIAFTPGSWGAGSG